MLAAVFGCKSSERFPASVTRPRFVGCLSCRWLPASPRPPNRRSQEARGSRGPSPASEVGRVRTASGGLNEKIECGADVGEGVGKEVAVGVQRDVDRCVPELRLEELGMGAGGDHERGVGVAEVVEAKWRKLGAADRRPEDPRHEVVLAPDRPAGRWEDEPELVRHTGEQLLAEDAKRLARKADLAPARARLRLDDLPLPRPGLN